MLIFGQERSQEAKKDFNQKIAILEYLENSKFRYELNTLNSGNEMRVLGNLETSITQHYPALFDMDITNNPSRGISICIHVNKRSHYIYTKDINCAQIDEQISLILDYSNKEEENICLLQNIFKEFILNNKEIQILKNIVKVIKPENMQVSFDKIRLVFEDEDLQLRFKRFRLEVIYSENRFTHPFPVILNFNYTTSMFEFYSPKNIKKKTWIATFMEF